MSHLPLDLAGRIHLHGLVPLQSIEKRWVEQHKNNMFGWVVSMHFAGWLLMHEIKNHPKLLQKSDNKLVCIGIPSGNP